MENKKIFTNIEDWAQYYVPEFNRLSEKYKTPYYTQSPLSNVGESVELMIVGINPKGELGTGKTELTWEEYLKGNKSWNERFLKDGTMHPDWKKRFLPDVHFFLGYDNYYHPESIDSDSKTIITNMTPFCSPKGFNKPMPSELIQIGLESIASLFSLVKPKRIVLLGANAFGNIQANMEDKTNVSYETLYKGFCVGQICGIPTVNVIHPASNGWVTNSFPPIFIFLHKIATDKFKLDIKNVADYMRKQIDAYKKL